MCRYKEKGNPLPLAVMEFVPLSERLPGLANIYGRDKVAAILSKAITKALSNFNLRVGMNSDQIVELSLMILDEAEDDQLAFQDIMLFLDGMVKFKYGKIYDRMDIPTFFEMLEKYREDRHQAFVRHKEELNSQFKGLGDPNRTTAEDQLRSALDKFSGSIGSAKNNL